MASKRVTSLDVARRASVSRTTVSLVLNNVKSAQISEGTRQRVMDAADDLGYVPNAAAQALASRRTQTVGLLLTRSPHHIASDLFLTQSIYGLIDATHQQGLRLLIDIIEPEHPKETYLQLVRARHIDGLFLSGPRFNDEALRVLEESRFPAVLLGQAPEINLCSVDVDNRRASRSAVDHLIGLGHSHIACVTNASLDYTAAVDRLAGYQDALQAAGLPYEERLVRYGDFDQESGYQEMKSLLESRPIPSAVFVASDVVAFGAIAAIHEAGLCIPGDVSVVGFDDVPFARFMEPPLTTIRLPALEQARLSADILFRQINQEPVADRLTLMETKLIVRQSCGERMDIARS